MSTVVIADNHPLFRSGVRRLIEASSDFTIVDEAGDCDSCLFKVRQHRPDIVLLDLNMPEYGGFKVAKELKSNGDLCKIVILSMHTSQEFVEMALAQKCDGFVAKEDAGPELLFALRNLHEGFQMTSSVGRGEKGSVDDLRDDAPNDGTRPNLTQAEYRILLETAQGATSSDIADQMEISPRTVETHRQNISRKLELSGANSLLRYAIENRKKIETWMDLFAKPGS